MSRLTKLEMAKNICSSPAWDGLIKKPEELCKRFSYEEIKDMYDMLDYAEEEYFESVYEG